jgi:hypothetical protein
MVKTWMLNASCRLHVTGYTVQNERVNPKSEAPNPKQTNQKSKYQMFENLGVAASFSLRFAG